MASSWSVRPSARLTFTGETRAGLKSATAAAITRASAGRSPARAPPNIARPSAARSSPVDSIRTTSTSAGSSTSTDPAISVTAAPRSRAASARATPIFPVERLPMKRTGSIGSRVPPAVTTMRRPARSASRTAWSRTGGRAAASGARTALFPTAATTASTIRSSSASRPIPDWPEASRPDSGSTIE